jgi:hypothetical protein
MKYIGLLLNIIAGISLWLLRRIGWVYGALTTKDFNKYNRDIALAKDQLGNVILAPLLNKLLITKAGYKFGNRKETISGVIGKNFLTSTLTKKGFSNGMFWYNFLERTDPKPNHCIRAIDYNI